MITAPSAVTTNAIPAAATTAPADTSPALLITSMDADRDSISDDKAVTVGNVVSTGSCANMHTIPASAPTTTVITTTPLIELPAAPDALDISANVAIRADKQTVAPISFDESSNDNAATDVAITAIAAVITIRFFLQSLAPLVAQTIAVIIPDNKPTTVRPFARLLTSIKLIRTQIPANIPIAAVIANSVPPIFVASGPVALTAFTRATSNAPKATTATDPFISSPADSILTSLQTPTIIVKASAMDVITPAIFRYLASSFDLIALFSAVVNIIKPSANAAPLSISSAESIPASLQTPTINPIAIAILAIMPPSLLTPFPLSLVTADNRPVNTMNTPMNATPLTRSSAERSPISLIAATININATDIFFIIIPALSIFLADSPFTHLPNVFNTMEMATMTPANPIKPCIISSGFIPPMILTTAANIRRATPIPASPVFKPSSFKARPSPSNVTVALLSLFTTKAKTTRIPERTATAATDLASAPWSS